MLSDIAFSYMSDDEVAQKFRHNCDGVLPQGNVECLIHDVMNLEGAGQNGTVSSSSRT